MPPANTRLPVPVVVHLDAVPIEAARGGVGITRRVHWENFEPGSHEAGLTTAYHPPGVACGEHNHRGGNETFIVVAGRGTIWVDGVPNRVKAGDSVFVPAGAYHNVAAAPQEESSEQFVVNCLLVRAKGHETDEQPWTPTGR